MGREGTAGQPLCADIDGFSQHAAVRVEAHERKRFEQLCRYNTRPAQSDERVQVNAARQVEVELKLKTPWRRERGVRAPNANCGAGELKIVATILRGEPGRSRDGTARRVGATLPDAGSIPRFLAFAPFQRDVKRSQEVSWAGGNKKPQSNQ